MEQQYSSQYDFSNHKTNTEKLLHSFVVRSMSWRTAMKDSVLSRYIKSNIVVVFLVHLLNTQICLSANLDARCDINVSGESTHELMNTLFLDCLEKKSVFIITNQSNFECSLWQPRKSKPYYLLSFEKVVRFTTYTFEERHMFEIKNASKWATKKFFVFEDVEPTNIQPIFEVIRNTDDWNSESIFIIKTTDTYGSCNLVADLFRVIWSFNVLNGYFICHHPRYGIILYTFNPYSSLAPEPWIRVETYIQQNGHPFTIFMNNESKDICKSVFWEKAKNLSHFPVKLANTSFSRYVLGEDDGVGEEAMDIIYEINNIIWRQLGAHIESKKFTWDEVGKIDGMTGNATKAISLVLRGEYECLVCRDFERGLWRNEVNLLSQSGVCYVTRKKLASIFEQMSKAFPLYTWLSFLLLFVFTTVLLSYLLKVSHQDMAIDVLRITVGATMIHPAKTVPSRVAVIYMLFVFTIINIYLQSKLEMLLTVEPSHKEFKTLTSLIENDYELHTTPYYWQYYSNSTYRHEFKTEASFERCLQLMRNNDKIACLNDCYDVKYGVEKRVDLMLHKDRFSPYDVQLFRDNSALKDQFQKVYVTLLESGVPDFLFELSDSGYRRPLYSNFQAISADQLEFAFNFLLISQIICCVIFLFDIFKLYERVNFEHFFGLE